MSKTLAMSKALALIAGLLMTTSAVHAEIPCPVMLVSGSLGHDAITLSFRNKGKLPIEQLRLSCKPAPGQKPADSICASESGVFYPGTQYTVRLGYPGLGHRPVAISVADVTMSSGARWDFQSADRCRSLRVSK